MTAPPRKASTAPVAALLALSPPTLHSADRGALIQFRSRSTGLAPALLRSPHSGRLSPSRENRPATARHPTPRAQRSRRPPPKHPRPPRAPLGVAAIYGVCAAIFPGGSAKYCGVSTGYCSLLMVGSIANSSRHSSVITGSTPSAAATA